MDERKKRSQYHSELNKEKRKKQDRLLNILIAVVSVLIVIKLFFIINDNDHTAQNKKETKEENAEEMLQQKTEEKLEETDAEKNTNLNDDGSQEKEVVTKVENDEYVEEIIENPNWEVTPTKQTGPHVSTFEEGHIDYEEKLQAISSAVQLAEDNIIYWSVRNNGSDSAISIISSKDQNEKYRVTIQWIENEGWKPVKVEKLKKLEGLVK